MQIKLNTNAFFAKSLTDLFRGENELCIPGPVISENLILKEEGKKKLLVKPDWIPM